MKPQIRVIHDADTFKTAAATEFARAAQEAIRAKGSFAVALSGGSTPKEMYTLLAHDPYFRSHVSWSRVHFFWGDERHVKHDHKDSNYRMANDAMLSIMPVAAAHVWRIKGEYPDASKAAAEYEQTIRDYFHLSPGELPRFDLVLLGMGPEGHTLSLFPGTKALHEEKRLVVSNWVGKFFTHRITMTAEVVNHASNVLFLVRGSEKQPALKAVLEGPYEPGQLPAQLIQPVGSCIWLLDEAAAGMLSPETCIA